MAEPRLRNIASPDTTREILKGRVDTVSLDGFTVTKIRYEPGYKWSESLKETAGTDSCQFKHLGYVLSGRLHVRMDDGTEAEVGPGDVFIVPPGHDGWVVGDVAFEALDFSSDMTGYAS